MSVTISFPFASGSGIRLLLAAAISCFAAAPGYSQDAVAAARDLATHGHRAEALAALDQRLEERPTDSDARVLRGVILSWEGRYDEARQDLQTVLAKSPDHGDALPALIHVEMWSDHPERAEQLAREALRRHPDDPDLLLAQARALRAMKKNREALATAKYLLRFDPGNRTAIDLASGLADSMRAWTASIDHSSEWFSDGRTPWQESQVQLSRQTAAGSVITRFSRADRFGSTSQQVEIDAYPHFRQGTYGYINLGYSPDAELYPHYRIGADLNQSLGHGIEASGGFRQLHFSGNVRIYTAAVTKYFGDWMFTGRTFLTPDITGTSESVQIQVRRYLANGTDYWGLRYGHGSSPTEVSDVTDIAILNSSSFSTQFYHTLSRYLICQINLGYSREDRVGISGLRHYLADASLFYRF
ncbi:MAG: YaiO family outer membrane beta-barrel protein [Acidobacteriia bacterium]|nr:YaiO family outer membrane beta-barrel protein [Terriglobia bacterium]